MNKSLEEPLGDDHSVSLQVVPEPSRASESTASSHSHGHSHDHGHGHGHGHSHGDACCSPKPRGKTPWYVIVGCEMKTFIYGMILSVWYSVFFYFCEPITDDFDRKGSKAAITFLVVMAIISYYRCSNTSSANPTKDVPVFAPNTEVCKKCNYWKPERTHHCSKCRQCVLRMDHHCPWIVNCVGYHNHKSFFLFCSYITTGSLFYTYRSFYFLVCVLADRSLVADLSYLFLVFWGILSCIIMAFAAMVGGLTYYHFNLALNNMTTLESMGGRNMRIACESHIALEKKMMNKYDRGFLANLYEFFGHSVLLWWWPDRPNAMYLGQYLKQVNMPTQREAQDFTHGRTNEQTEEDKMLRPKQIGDIDLHKVFKMAEEFAPDTTFQFFDKTFTMEGAKTEAPVEAQNSENQQELMNS